MTSPILDLTVVGLDVVDDHSSSHGQQPHFLKTCLNPSLDLGSTVLLLGHNRRDLAVGEGKVVIATDNLISSQLMKSCGILDLLGLICMEI